MPPAGICLLELCSSNDFSIILILFELEFHYIYNKNFLLTEYELLGDTLERVLPLRNCCCAPISVEMNPIMAMTTDKSRVSKRLLFLKAYCYVFRITVWTDYRMTKVIKRPSVCLNSWD